MEIVEELKFLKPAETLLILDPQKSTAKELAKVTLLDLLGIECENDYFLVFTP